MIRMPRRARSAAQNEPVLQICSQCGAVNNDGAEVCPFCETAFAPAELTDLAAPTTSEEPEWRREVARRLEIYRARRRRSHPDKSQTTLPFGQGETESCESRAAAAQPRTLARFHPTERLEIRVSQPELDFSAEQIYATPSLVSTLPVADLAVRRWAGLMDTGVLLGVYAGFLALFHSLGGQLGWARVDLVVYAVALFLLYLFYFSLFTLFIGITPGMQARGLAVVCLDGSAPETRQLLWRTFGYLLSGGTFLLGFLWALWDEDHLTWQDRISQTYLTSAPLEADSETVGKTHTEHSFS